MNILDADMACFIHSEMRRHGIKMVPGHTVEGFSARSSRIDVLLKDAARLYADSVILATGVTPETKPARDAGLALGIKDRILVNDRIAPSVPDIYAVGAAVQIWHAVTGEDALISLVDPPSKQRVHHGR